ncbi:hypothetical protein B0O95_11340 [Mycetohabitans endofungorum]|uniref:Uncharacterized protein n=1 Tax=Mycetohabitans endofungorum TaxID=417203 RepID=A0A2P5K7U9_9BURK|nr:hypothetical protein B0O95_11340 [Mycetohabitans endofungorum]
MRSMRRINAASISSPAPVSAKRDVVEDQFGPAEQVEDPIGGGELHAGVPFVSGAPGRRHRVLRCGPVRLLVAGTVVPDQASVTIVTAYRCTRNQYDACAHIL